MSDINTYQDKNGIYKPFTENIPVTQIRDSINTTNALATVNNGIIPQLTHYENSVRSLEHTNQRYWQAEANRHSVWNNEASKYGFLMSSQNNMLNQINYPEIRLWRYQNHLYYRTRNGQLIIDNQIEISTEHYQELIQYQLNHYYQSIKPKTTVQPTEEEMMTIIQQFKTDLISKNLTESSCLHKLVISAPKRLKEIKEDFEYVTTKNQLYRPRVRQQELSTIFQLVFELDYLIDNSKFIDKLKGAGDMFDRSCSSGTRSAKFTSDGASKTEQYYYFDPYYESVFAIFQTKIKCFDNFIKSLKYTQNIA